MKLRNLRRSGGLVALLGAAIITLAGSAKADWQYTRWGMSKEQVIEASKGTAKTPTKPDVYEDDEFTHLLSAPYKSGDLQFDAKFHFSKDGKLTRVILEYGNRDDCSRLHRMLSSAYGPGEVHELSLGTVIKWWDKNNGNHVIFADAPPVICDIQYKPLQDPGKDGGL